MISLSLWIALLILLVNLLWYNLRRTGHAKVYE